MIFFAGSFPCLLYKIIPAALAGISRVGNVDDLVSGELLLFSWGIAQRFYTSDPCLPGRHQAFPHMATENLKSSDGIKDVKTFCYSQSCVG